MLIFLYNLYTESDSKEAGDCKQQIKVNNQTCHVQTPQQ